MKKYSFFRYKKLKIFLILNIAVVSLIVSMNFVFSVHGEYLYLKSYYQNSLKIPQGVAYIEAPIYSTKFDAGTTDLKNSSKKYLAHSQKQLDDLTSLKYVTDVNPLFGYSKIYHDLSLENVTSVDDVEIDMLPSGIKYINILNNVDKEDSSFIKVDGRMPSKDTEIMTSPIIKGKEYKVGDSITYKSRTYTIVGIGGYNNSETNEVYFDVIILPYNTSYYLEDINNKETLNTELDYVAGEKKASTLYEPYGNLIVSYDKNYEKEFFDFLDQNFYDSTIYSANYNSSVDETFAYFSVIRDNIIMYRNFLFLSLGYTMIILLALIYMQNKESKKLKLYHYTKKEIRNINNLEIMSIYAVSSILSLCFAFILYKQYLKMFMVYLIAVVIVQFVILKMYTFLVNKAFYD